MPVKSAANEADQSGMTQHPASAPPITAPAAPSRDRVRTWMLRGVGTLGIVCLFMLSLLLGDYVLRSFSGSVQISASMLLLTSVLVVLMGGGAIARDLVYWRRSTRVLARMVNELRAGETPLAELDRVGGGARSLVEPIRSILLDLREQKRTNAELQHEMRQRILSRTDALERQLGSLKAQASRDSLTGLGNRRAFDSILPQVFNACQGSAEDLCALMIDVDNFKPLNDTLGHGAGDELLKSIGEIIRSSIREHDSAFRVGGDEFVILLPRASKVIGERLAARLTSLVDHLARPLKLPRPPGLSIGASALSDEKMKEAKQLIDLADRRLYLMKASKPQRGERSVA